MRSRIRIGVLFFIVLAVSLAFVVLDRFSVSKKEYHVLLNTHPIRERLSMSKAQRKKMGIPPNKYFDQQYLLEINPKTGKTHPENLLSVKQNRVKSTTKFSKVPGQSTDMAWVERGPNNIAGRTRVVFYDPNDSTGKRVFAGGVSGGLWVNNNIEDENSLWSQVGIDENLSVSCFAIDPNDSNTWYVGTGEAYTGDDGVGNGIWVTQNGGSTWNQLLSVDLNNDVSIRPYVVTEIVAWNNNGITELYFSLDGKFDIDAVAFTTLGWWRTSDNGSIDRIDFRTLEGTPYVFSDVEIAADNSMWLGTKSNIFGNGGGKVFRSTDGVTFEEKHAFLNGERVELTVSKQNSNVVYALASTNRSSEIELVKTTDGSNFVSVAKPNDVDIDIPAQDFARGQGFYNLTLEIDPKNDEILYAGGIDLFRSINSGTSWSQISKWENVNNLRNLQVSLVHPDQHNVAFNPLDANKGVFANDGGVYYCSDLSNSANIENIVERNKNYNITQFYSAAISQDENNEFLLGGAQDNGNLFSFQAVSGINSFGDISGGDGIQTFIDKDGTYLITSFVNNVYNLDPLPLRNITNRIEIASDQSTGTFANIADLDDNLDILYTDGSRYGSRGGVIGSPRIFAFDDITTTPQRTILTNAIFNESPTAIKASPFTTNSSTIFIGTEGASILKVINANTTNPIWENIDVGSVINIGSVSDIDFGASENEILVTLHNYGVVSVYYTQNGGITWQEKEGDFPDIPVKAIKMNPLNRDEVIIGTNMGVWRTSNFTDISPNWHESFNGMSNVRVTQFDLRASDNTVLASTYGRGLFTGAFTERSLSFKENEKTNLLDIDTFVSSTGVSSIYLKNLDPNETIQVKLFTISGNLVLEKQEQLTGSELKIETLVQSGIYIVNLRYKGRTFRKKVMITN